MGSNSLPSGSATMRHRLSPWSMSLSLVAGRFPSPRERLLGVFEVQGLSFVEPGFRGCAFVSASTEAASGSSVEEAAGDYGPGCGHCSWISAWMDHDPSVADAARTVAKALIDSETD
jgi:hypothetical protein